MRITIDGFDDVLIKRKQIPIDGYGRTKTYYRLLKNFAVIMNKVLSGDGIIHCPPDRDSTHKRAIANRQK